MKGSFHKTMLNQRLNNLAILPLGMDTDEYLRIILSENKTDVPYSEFILQCLVRLMDLHAKTSRRECDCFSDTFDGWYHEELMSSIRGEKVPFPFFEGSDAVPERVGASGGGIGVLGLIGASVSLGALVIYVIDRFMH